MSKRSRGLSIGDRIFTSQAEAMKACRSIIGVSDPELERAFIDFHASNVHASNAVLRVISREANLRAGRRAHRDQP